MNLKSVSAIAFMVVSLSIITTSTTVADWTKPILLSVESGEYDAVKKLIDEGADVNACDKEAHFILSWE